MAYVKNTWTTGDVITAEKLNNLEDGVEGAGFLSNVYAVYGDYADGDFVDNEQMQIVNAVIGNGGMVFIWIYLPAKSTNCLFVFTERGGFTPDGAYNAYLNDETGEITFSS